MTGKLSMNEFTDKIIKAYQVDRMTIRWEGGNDSGHIYCEFIDVNGDIITLPSAVEGVFTELVANVLDYGSWAGDFNADGSVVYDPITNNFTGNNNYSESITKNFDISSFTISKELLEEIYLPSKEELPFTRIDIDSTLNDEEEEENSVKIMIGKGYKKDLYQAYEHLIGEQMIAILNEIFEKTSGIDNINEINGLYIDHTYIGEEKLFKKYKFLKSPDYHNFELVKCESTTVGSEVQVIPFTHLKINVEGYSETTDDLIIDLDFVEDFDYENYSSEEAKEIYHFLTPTSNTEDEVKNPKSGKKKV